VDLLDFFRGRRPWPQLLRLVARLPEHSHYKAALVQDERYAEAVLATEQAGTMPHHQPLVGWTREAAVIADLFDRLTALMASDPGKVTPYPRPKTAVDRARADAALARHKARVRLMLPGPSRPGQS
jgi:hypothetical protein